MVPQRHTKACSRQNEVVSEDQYDQLRRSIAKSDPFELSIALAALQLMPENAGALAILESAAEFVATLRAPRTRTVRQADLAAVIRAFEMTCDPFEGLFTVSLMPPDVGPTTAFCGRDPASPFVISALMAAIFGGPTPMEPAFTGDALAQCGALLVLANAVATRARVARGTSAADGAADAVVVPEQARLDELRSAVRFTTAELRGLLGPRAVDLVLPVAHAQGGAVPGGLLSGPLHHNPLLVSDGELVVALPGLILPALTELLITRAGALRPQLALRFRAAVRESVHDSLRELGLRGPWEGDRWDAPERVVSMTTQVDTDAALAVHVAVDGLDGFEVDGLDSAWRDAQALVDEMERRSLEAEQSLSSRVEDAPNTILHLFVVQGVGRPFAMGLDDPPAPLESPRLLLSAEELTVISVLEAHEPLALLKFARAKRALHERTQVMAFGTLAPYQIYRHHEHSFYFGDDPPTLVVIDDGWAEQARIAAHKKRDAHAVELPGRHEYALVQLLDEDVRVPLYRESRPERGYVRLLAELNVDCWVSVALPQHDSAVSVALSYAGVAAYWLWQLQPAAVRMLEAASDGHQLCVVLELEVGPEFDGPTDVRPGEIATRVETDAVVLRIPSSFTNALAGSDNSGERTFVRALLAGIRASAAARGYAPPSDATIDTWIEEYAPLDLKKKALHVSLAQNFALADEGLPRARPLQDPDFSEVLDELGEVLRRRGRAVGPIAAGDRLDVLREAVDWSFSELEREIATLAPGGLFNWLVLHHEAILSRQANARLGTPSHLACYPTLDDLPRRLDEERLRLLRTAFALRIVIEAVVASPPHGLRPMSLATHDRLIALAEEGINRAYARDALQNTLLDVPLSILPSGRLGMPHEGPFYTGQTTYLGVMAQVELEHATRTFPKHWDSAAATPDEWEGSALDHAAKFEFGFTLTELTTLCVEIGAFGLEKVEGEVKRVPRRELVATIAQRLGWQLADIDAALELFALRQRDGLRHASDGFEAADAYPWRMNRRLSYLRRPLIELPTESGPELIWATRHLKDGNQYLIQLCEEGRLRARTSEMQKAIATVRAAQTRAFNAAVADRIGAHGFVVRTNVKKIGKLRIMRESGADLGDIDVLAADPKSRVLLAVETKDLGLARTPLEMGQQIRDIFVGADDHRCDIDKHLDRVNWLRQHLADAMSFLAIDDDASKWTIRPLLVTDEPLITPYIVSTKIPVLALRDLHDARGLRDA